MPRITRISGSLVIVLIAYWAYALVVVSWIEPHVDLTSAGQAAYEPTQGDGNDLVTLERRSIQDLFQPSDWEITSPSTKVLKSDRAKLLLQTYKNLGGGKVSLEPSTIVFDYDGPADNEEQRHRQSIILQAPAGAILQFDRPLDLKQPRDANLLGGQLNGTVLIHSDWKQPGPADDLRIVTSNICLTKQTISTSDPVEFCWGPHFGSGQDMQIKLLPGKPKPGMGTSGLNVGGIESFELRHLERLHLDLPAEKGISPISKNDPRGVEKGTDPIARNGPQRASHQLDLSPFPRSTPVEITCRGPFRFDVVGRVATFNDSVLVVRPNPTGAPDQIVCDLLSIGFIERPKKGSGAAAGKALAAKKTGSMDLAPERLEARGNPAVVTAPSENVIARAQRIEYNLLAKTLTLDGDQPVFLQQGPNEVHARSLFYQSAADERRLGQVVSQGPGWLHGQSRDQPEQQLEAVWRDELRIQPRDQYQQISLTGGAELKSPGFGQLQAKRIFLWLLENPSAAKNQRLKPHGLSASEDVHFDSPQISGKEFEQLEVWFEDAANLVTTSMQRNQGMGGLPPVAASAGTGVQPSPQLPAQPTSSSQPIALLPPTDRPQHFEVTGRLLRARVLVGTPKPLLSQLTIEDGVQLLETQTPQPGERPLVVRGDRLDVANASGPDTHATVIGKPARFEGRGLGLTGSNINIDRDTNRLTTHLWIDGPGQMDVLIATDLEGKPLPAPSTLTVDWQQSMDFDGQTARFRQSVVAATPGIPSQTEMTQFQLKTDQMAVQLQQPIRLSEQKSDQKRSEPPQIEEIRCGGGVAMDSRTFDNRQQLVSHDQMQLTDLAVNRLSGALNGGPGWINTVRYGSDDMLAGQPAAAPANTPAKADRLFCLHVKYRGSVTGNTGNLLVRPQATFHDQVQITCGPVDNWDAVLTTDDPSRLGPDGAVAHCDELSVVQMLLPVGGRRAMELCMLGNAVAEGTTYKALGHRITYAQAKDLLTLEGDGRSPAELFRQMQIGAPATRLPAQKILYWPKTNDVRVIGAQMLEVQLPDGKKR
jgi:hypothetical protein